MEFTISQLAALTGATIEGNPDLTVNNFAKIEEATEGCLTFLANPKYTHYIYDTQATAVLVRSDFVPEHPVKATLLRVPDPYDTLARLMAVVSARPMPVGVEQPSFIADGVVVPEGAYIGAFAYVGKSATLGKNVKIYPQAFVGEGASVGADTIIYPGAKIYPGCKIGERCVIHSGAVIGADGFGFAPTEHGYDKIPQIGNVVIEDDVEVGANTAIDRATMGSTIIGRGTKLDNLIQIGHNVTIGEDNVFAAQTGVAGSCHIGNRNMVGGQVGFAGHLTIGDRNKFGAQTGVAENVDDGKSLMGTPAVPFGQFARSHVYVKRLHELFKNNK